MTETKALTLTKHLLVKLDMYRETALNHQMRDSTMEEERIAAHLKNVTDSLRSSIKEHAKKRVIAASALSQGFEMMPVSCEQKIEAEKMVTYRLDTNEKVDERALTADEIKHYRTKNGKP